MQEQREQMFTQTKLLEMGFTKGIISRLLPTPIEKPNHMYKNAAPIKLWHEKDVLGAMETDDFKKSLEKREKRKQAAKKAAETKKNNLVECYKELLEKITVIVIDDDVLKENTLAAKREWYNGRERYYSSEYGNDLYSVDENTLNRWIVNYIRHNLINYDNYDNAVSNLKGEIGKDSAYGVFKRGVLAKIAEAYPKYADECASQIGCVQY